MSAGDHRFALTRGFPADSGFLDGHFPGNPIVPGAVLLGFLADRLAAAGVVIEGVQRMKFMRPLDPGTPFEVTVSPKGAGARAEFRDATGVFASATLTLSAVDG